MKRSLSLVLAIMLLVSLGGVVSCGKAGIAGTYVNQDNPSEYLELNKDGTFYLKEMGMGFDGEWEIEGNELRLHFTMMGLVATGEIKGNKLYDEDGKVWVKQSKPSEEETSAPLESTTPAPTAQKASTDDIEWLATVIASEAGSVWDVDRWVRCTDEERAAVGWTVLNRLSSGTFGKTVEEVVTAPAQYAHNQQPTSEIRKLAEKLLEGQIPDATGGATHFFSPISMPKEGEEYKCKPPVGSGVMNCNGELHTVPGIAKRVYFPSWTKTYTWVSDLNNVRQAYFMFYRLVSPPMPMKEYVDETRGFSISVPAAWEKHDLDAGGSVIWLLPEEASKVSATFIEVMVIHSRWPEPFTEKGIRDYYQRICTLCEVVGIQVEGESCARYSVLFEDNPEEMHLLVSYLEYYIEVRARGSSEKRLEEYREVFDYSLDSFRTLKAQ